MPQIHYAAPLQVLVAVRGHALDRNDFDAMFQAMPDVNAVMVDQPAVARLMNPEGMAGFDALVLYDMPGMDFAADPMPGWVDPGAGFRAGFEALLAAGVGVVALHHALAGWPAWPAYGEALGGAFLYRAGERRGSWRMDSGYRHGVEYVAEVIDPAHPVMAGVPATFAMRDELYLAEVDVDRVTPLLRARHRFVADGFYSAEAAMEGRMFDNAGWDHPEGSDLIGWTREIGPSRVVYLQPGDDRETYDNPHYRRMVENAIRWVARSGVRSGV